MRVMKGGGGEGTLPYPYLELARPQSTIKGREASLHALAGGLVGLRLVVRVFALQQLQSLRDMRVALGPSQNRDVKAVQAEQAEAGVRNDLDRGPECARAYERRGEKGGGVNTYKKEGTWREPPQDKSRAAGLACEFVFPN